MGTESARYTIINADVIEGLRQIPDESVQCCITSPPFFGLRDYGVDGQIGLEKTLDAYKVRLVEVFSEVWRVLRNDGTLWIEMGDSYASAWCCSRRNVVGNGALEHGKRADRPNRLEGVLKEKDLMGVPWRVAFALQEAGWYLRSDIIWAKPNAMPGSQTDRCTSSHTYVFMLTKRSKYFYDHVAIMEPAVGGASGNKEATPNAQPNRSHNARGIPWEGRDLRTKRDVWTIPTYAYKAAHFATFSPELVRPMILAGTPAYGSCAACGAPWVRVVEKTGHKNQREPAHVPRNSKSTTDSTGWQPTTRPTDQWMPSCKCGTDESEPSLVLDPFLGSGTTVMVALQEGRRGVGIELNPEYVEMARTRIMDGQVRPQKRPKSRRVATAASSMCTVCLGFHERNDVEACRRLQAEAGDEVLV